MIDYHADLPDDRANTVLFGGRDSWKPTHCRLSINVEKPMTLLKLPSDFNISVSIVSACCVKTIYIHIYPHTIYQRKVWNRSNVQGCSEFHLTKSILYLHTTVYLINLSIFIGLFRIFIQKTIASEMIEVEWNAKTINGTSSIFIVIENDQCIEAMTAPPQYQWQSTIIHTHILFIP